MPEAVIVAAARSPIGRATKGSLADVRPDAWRCFLGNLILDPCFSNETGTTGFVICADG